MRRSLDAISLLTAAALSLDPLAAAAQPALLNGRAGAWLNAARSAADAPLGAQARPAPEAPRQDDAVLGVFRTETDSGLELWTWRQGDSDLSSAKLRENLANPKTTGIRSLNKILGAAGAGAWLVARRKAAEGEVSSAMFLFNDAEGKTFYAEIESKKTYGSKDAPVILPLSLRRDGEKLLATYGAPAAGLLEVHRFTPEGGDAALGMFSFAQDPKTKAPALKSATLFGDADALAALASQPGLSGTAGMKDLLGNKALLEKMDKILKAGESFSVAAGELGGTEIRRHSGPKDKEGVPYIYIIDGKALEAGE